MGGERVLNYELNWDLEQTDLEYLRAATIMVLSQNQAELGSACRGQEGCTFGQSAGGVADVPCFVFFAYNGH